MANGKGLVVGQKQYFDWVGVQDKGQENRIRALTKTRSPEGSQMALNPGSAGKTNEKPTGSHSGGESNQ